MVGGTDAPTSNEQQRAGGLFAQGAAFLRHRFSAICCLGSPVFCTPRTRLPMFGASCFRQKHLPPFHCSAKQTPAGTQLEKKTQNRALALVSARKTNPGTRSAGPLLAPLLLPRVPLSHCRVEDRVPVQRHLLTTAPVERIE